MDYSHNLVIALLKNLELIEEFVTSTTIKLTPSYYTFPKPTDDFFNQEGHTLWNDASQTTHVPSKGNFREELICMTADLAFARSQVLTEDEDAALDYRYAESKPGRVSKYLTETSDLAVEKVVQFLNDGLRP